MSKKAQHDPGGNVKIIVITVSIDLGACDDFSCLPDGSTIGDNYSKYDDKASIGSDINCIRDTICRSRTSSPISHHKYHMMEKNTKLLCEVIFV